MDYPLGTAVKLRETFSVLGVLTNPTTVTIHVLWPDGTTHDYTDPDVENPSTGIFDLVLEPADYTLVGTYVYWGIGTGAVEATSRPRSFTITSVIGDGEHGPCEPWITSDDVEECCSAAESSIDYTEAADAASQVLFKLVPRYSGTCGPRLVRPCGTRCGAMWQGLSWVGDGWWRSTTMFGIGIGDPPPATRGCGCNPLSRVLLAGRVRDVLEVKIDGAVVDPSTYRLDGRKYLTRLPDADGNRQFWPSCQNLELDESQDGTFSVLYTFGVSAPLPAKMAARELACAIFQTCALDADANPEDCPLPNNVTRVQRQGITIDLTAFTGWGFDPKRRQWQTGLPLVDMFLNAYNPGGRRKRRSLVWSPDMDRAAKKLGT